ncbi:ERC protein 2-like, partial [Clarias magur]
MKTTTTTLMALHTTSNLGHSTPMPTPRLCLQPRDSPCIHMPPYLNSKPLTHIPYMPNIHNPYLHTLILNRHLILSTPNTPNNLALTNTHPGPSSPTLSTRTPVPLLSNTLSTLNTGHRHNKAPIPNTLNTLNTPNTPNTPTTLLMRLHTGRTLDIQPRTTAPPPEGHPMQDTDPPQIRMTKRAFGHNHFQTKAVLIFYT